MKKTKTIIGSLDKADFPLFDLEDIPCKIDTGAETSAIHCHRVRIIESEGQEWIAFRLLDPSHPAYQDREFRITDFKERKVRSSSGHADYRYVIKTKIRLFGRVFRTEFTLADREKMKYPVLLGKRLLKGRFLVDVSQKNLSQQFKNTSKPL